MPDFSLLQRNRKSIRELLRYSLLGITINASGYLMYLLITFLGVPPKVAVTVLYFVAAFVGYWGNRQLTFKHQGSVWGSGARYIIAHGLGYLLNLAMLIIFVDQLHYPHQWVQAAAVFTVAGFLFLAFKFFVYAEPRQPGTGAS